MIKRHRDQRTSIKADRESKKSHHKDKNAEKTIDKAEIHVRVWVLWFKMIILLNGGGVSG